MMNGTQVKWGGGGGGGATYVFKVRKTLNRQVGKQKVIVMMMTYWVSQQLFFFNITFSPFLTSSITNGAP